MQIETVQIKDLILYEKNARTHPKKQIDLLAKNIERFGFTTPCLIDKNNNVIAGHGRIEAIKKLGRNEIPCVRLENLSDDEVKALRIADNKTNMPYTGTTPFKREYLPANVTTALAAGKISIPREVTVVVKNGKIEAIRTSNGEISRQAIENLQKKVNTEPVKGAQPVYGNPKTKQVEQKPKTGYSRADLKSGGWTDEQIDKAVKAGKIKLN